MLISWQRLIYFLSLAAAEATPAALLLTLAERDAWGALIVVALAGALADWLVLRRVRPARQGLAMVGLGLAAALWLVKALVLGSAGPLAGWGAALGLLLAPGGAGAGVAYLSLLVGLYCFWRGTRLALHDSVSLHRLFRTATIVLMLIVLGGFFASGGHLALVELASTEVLGFFAVGLLAIALASASEERESELQRMGWRGLLTLAGAIVLVIVAGVAVGALFGREAALMLQLLWQGLVLLLALLLAPLLYLLAGLFEWLFRLLHLERIFDVLPPQVNLPADQVVPAAGGLLAIFPPWVQVLIRAFFAVLPIAIILALLYFVRRRRRRAGAPDEERESLWSWGGLANDLRGLLGRMRPAPPPGGLREALARLRGADPASRVRRSYIRLLLVGEARGQPRPSPHTAREYSPAAQAMLPPAAQPVARLSEAYERARYDPAGVSAAEADAAEQAWGAIERADRQQPRAKQ